MNRLDRLKRKAKRLYLAATTVPDHLDCGLALARCIDSGMRKAERKFSVVYAKIQRLDQDAPPNPFGEEIPK